MIHFDSVCSAPVGFTEPSLDRALSEDFATVPAVACVLTKWEEGLLKVLVALDDTSRINRHRVYDKQAAMIDAFPAVEFDFHVIPRLGRSVRELCSERIDHAFVREA